MGEDAIYISLSLWLQYAKGRQGATVAMESPLHDGSSRWEIMVAWIGVLTLEINSLLLSKK